MNPYLPPNQQDSDKDSTPDEVWDYACEKFGTLNPTEGQLDLADKEIYEAWFKYENYYDDRGDDENGL